MTNFWEYENRREYLRKKADEWTIEARKSAFNTISARQTQAAGYDPSMTPRLTTGLDKPLLGESQVDEIQPKGSGGNGFLKKIGWTDIDQPWDILRPVARLFEAENKYIARPMAKASYNLISSGIELTGADLPEYDELPEGVRVGAEILTSPTTWIGPGLAGRIVRNAPRVAMGLPLLGVAAPGKGSRVALRYVLENTGGAIGAGAGQEVADLLGAPDIIGQTLGGVAGFRGGAKLVGKVDDLSFKMVPPDLDEPIQTATGLNSRFKPTYESTPPAMWLGGQSRFTQGNTNLFVTHRPDIDDTWFELSIERQGASGGYSARNSKGSDIRSLLNFKSVIDDLIENNPEAQFVSHPTDMRRMEMYQRIGFRRMNGEEMKKYFDIRDGSTIEIEPGGLEPLMLDRDSFTGFRQGGDSVGPMASMVENPGVADMKAKLKKALGQPDSQPDLETALRSDDEAMEALSKRGQIKGGKMTGGYNKFSADLKKSLDIEGVLKRFEDGSYTLDDQLKASAFLRSQGIEPPKYVPGAGTIDKPDKITKLLESIYGRSDSMFRAQGEADLIEDAASHVSIAQRARQIALTKDWLPPKVKQFIKSGYYINNPILLDLREHLRMRAQSHNIGAAAVDYQRSLVNKLQPILDREGLSIEGLVDKYKTIDLSPEELALVDQFTRITGEIMNIAERWGVRDIPEFETATGRFVSLQGKLEKPIKTRIGARQPITLPQQWENLDEALGEGAQLRNYFDAQEAMFTQLLTAASDNWLGAILSKHGKTMSELIETRVGDDIITQRQDLSKLINQTDNLRQEISRAVRSTESTNLKKGIFVFPNNKELQTIVDTARDAVSKSKKADRRAGLIQARELVDLVLPSMREKNLELQKQIKKTAGQLKRSGDPEYPVSYKGRFYPEEGRALEALERGPGPDDPITWFNKQFRPIMATLDASFLGNQGLLGLARNPSAYLRSLVAGFSGESYEQLVRDMSEKGTLRDFLAHDGVWVARNDLGEFMFNGAIVDYFKKTPGISKAADMSNTWFSRFGNAMRLKLYDASLPLAKTAEQKRALARNVNLATGFSDNPATRWENMGVFAPRFFRSQMGLLADAVTKTDLAGDQARVMLRNLVIGGSAMVFAVNEALGEETDFNPESPNFMRMRIAGQDISPFGTWDTLVRGIIKLTTDGPIEAAEYMGSAKASPAMARLFDIIRGETFQGDAVQWGDTKSIVESFANLGSQLIPISLQEARDNISENGLSLEAGVALSTGMLGTKASPVTERERRDIISKDQFGKYWAELEPYQRDQLREQYPHISAVSAKTSFDVAMQKRLAITQRFAERQSQVDYQYPPGPEWREMRANLVREMAGAFDEWEEENPEAASRLGNRIPRNDNERAQNEFYAVFDEAKRLNLTPDEVGRRLDEIQSKWSSDQRAYFQRNTGLNDTPQVAEYRKDIKALDNYWAIEDQVWDRINDRPEFQGFDSLDAYVQDKVDILRRSGVPENAIAYRVKELPIVKQYNSLVSNLKQRYRQAHPEADAALVKWWGAVPIRLQ